MKKKLFSLLLAVAAGVGINAKVIDLSDVGTTISDWTVNEATLNSSESDESNGKYVYDIKGGVASESFINAEPDVVFQIKTVSDKAKAFAVYPGKCYEFGGKNGILIIKNTAAGDKIVISVAAKGSTAANFVDPDGAYPKQAIAVSEDLTLPAKDKGKAGTEGYDLEGYCWKELEYTSLGGDVEIKGFAGGYRIRSIQVVGSLNHGTCGDNLTWNLTGGVLTISGTGAMNDYSGTSAPWYYYRSSITSVIVENGVTSIGNYAFSYCSGLTSITIPNSVTSIGRNAFIGCSGLTTPVYNAHVFAFMPISYSGAYTIPDGIESIAGAAFSDCSSLTSVTIPNSVTSIGEWAFYGCSGLTSVTIPNSVTEIRWWAFSDCTGLTSVTIPNSVTSIGDEAFRKCTGLTSVIIPNSVTSIGYCAFARCSSLTSVMIEAGTPPTIEAYAFYDEDDYGYPTNPLNISIYVPCGTLDTYKTAEVWSDYASLIKYVPLPYKVSTIAENGNVTTTDVTTLTICDEPFITCTATPDYGYHFTQWSDGNTDNPRTIVLTQDTTFTAEFAIDRVGTCGKDLALVWSYDPNSKVLTIGNAGSFTENMQFGAEAPTEMEELVIGNSVTAIGANAFAGIETLTKVSIGESVKTIGEQAFFNCVNLETIFNYRPTPTNAYSNAFDGVDKFECKLYVLPSSIDMYKVAAVWRDFYYTYAIGAEEATVTTNDVQVEPQDNAATLTWPTSNNAATYTIEITKDGVLFCTLTFNSNGQLTGIAFAPSRDGQAHAPAAVMTANGLQFTVTGLNSGTQYGYNLTAKDAKDQTVATYSGSFTTTSEGETTGVEDVSSSLQGGDRGRLILRNGQIFILRGEKIYNAQGALVK